MTTFEKKIAHLENEADKDLDFKSGFREGHAQAVKQMEELLQNSHENEGGIYWGNSFLQNAHWDHELQDQLLELKPEQPE